MCTVFRRLLMQCGIAHAGRGRGPRIHDFRHLFAVHTLRRWYRTGQDLDAKLPLLATYLGHQHLSGTQYYLHLTAELFPEITARTDAAFGDVTGARVQELIDLSVGDVRLDSPAQLRLTGKGRKTRAVPLMPGTVRLLRDHIWENRLGGPERFDAPLFQNARHQRLTRSGVRYLLHKYLVRARAKCPGLNRPVGPHTLRHTKGIHLLQSGISLDMIRDFLGHVDVQTTQGSWGG